MKYQGLTIMTWRYAIQPSVFRTSDKFPSLNLSHAVQIITYELFRAAQRKSKHYGYRPINREELDGLTAGITANLKEIGFFKQVDDIDMRTFFRDILARSALSAGEAGRLGGIFDKIKGLAKRNQGKAWLSNTYNPRTSQRCGFKTLAVDIIV